MVLTSPLAPRAKRSLRREHQDCLLESTGSETVVDGLLCLPQNVRSVAEQLPEQKTLSRLYDCVIAERRFIRRTFTRPYHHLFVGNLSKLLAESNMCITG
jgi:hypothetical protein